MDQDGTQRAACRVRVRGNSGKITEVSIVLDETKLSPLDGIVLDSHDAYLAKAAELYNVKLDVQVARKVGPKLGLVSYVCRDLLEKPTRPRWKI